MKIIWKWSVFIGIHVGLFEFENELVENIIFTDEHVLIRSVDRKRSRAVSKLLRSLVD